MALPSYNTSLITAVARSIQGIPIPKFIIGGKGGSGGTTFNLQSKATTYTFAMWRSKPYVIGHPFNILSIKLTLAAAIASNMTITPVIGLDDGSTVVEGTVINSTNYTGSERFIQISPESFSNQVQASRNFWLELRFSGTALSPVSLPLTIDIEVEAML